MLVLNLSATLEAIYNRVRLKNKDFFNYTSAYGYGYFNEAVGALFGRKSVQGSSGEMSNVVRLKKCEIYGGEAAKIWECFLHIWTRSF